MKCVFFYGINFENSLQLFNYFFFYPLFTLFFICIFNIRISMKTHPCYSHSRSFQSNYYYKFYCLKMSEMNAHFN